MRICNARDIKITDDGEILSKLCDTCTRILIKRKKTSICQPYEINVFSYFAFFFTVFLNYIMYYAKRKNNISFGKVERIDCHRIHGTVQVSFYPL